MLVLKFLFVITLVVSYLIMLRMLKKPIETTEVPSSVYERAVVWHQNIMNISDPDKKMQEFARWKKFVEKIPTNPNKNKFFID